MNDLEIIGPIKFKDLDSITLSDTLNKKGIYLWTIKKDDDYLVHYVGETGNSFKNRLDEHLKSLKTGKYRIYDPVEFLKAQKKLLWNPYFKGALRRQNYLSEFEEFHSMIVNEIQRYIDLFYLFIIPFEGNNRIRKRLEAAIAKTVKAVSKNFFDDGITFQDIWWHGETHLSFYLKSKHIINGLRDNILV